MPCVLITDVNPYILEFVAADKSRLENMDWFCLSSISPTFSPTKSRPQFDTPKIVFCFCKIFIIVSYVRVLALPDWAYTVAFQTAKNQLRSLSLIKHRYVFALQSQYYLKQFATWQYTCSKTLKVIKYILEIATTSNKPNSISSATTTTVVSVLIILAAATVIVSLCLMMRTGRCNGEYC